MKRLTYAMAVAAVVCLGLMASAPGRAADAKTHRIAFQIDQNNPALMNLVLNNVQNLMSY